MGFEQYHEPAEELPQDVRTFTRMIVSMTEEGEAIDWYEQRMSVEKDNQAKEIMANAQQEEMKHFAMDLEFLVRQKPDWKMALQEVLFKQGDILQNAREAEQKITQKKAA